jgi:hypothetical protein
VQLGSFLDGAKSRPAVTRPVKFKVGATNAGAQPTSVEVEAVLAYVDEGARESIPLEAAAYLAQKFKGKPVPDITRRNEEAIRFLALALRDKSDPAKPLCSGGVEELRPVLVYAVGEWLGDEYRALIDAEYLVAPEPEDVEKIKDEAAGK